MERFSFGSYEFKKTLKGLLIAVSGTVLSYIAVQIIPTLDLGSYMWLIPLMSTLVNAGIQWTKDNSQN